MALPFAPARRWLDEHWPALATAAAIAILVAWAFFTRYRFLAASPYPLGVDGYFYPIQLRSLLAGDGLYYASAPLTLWLMTPLAALTDPIVGAKLGAALGSALVAVPVYFLGRRLSGDRTIGLLAAALIVTSTESFYLSVEFVKNGVALAIAATYLCSLLRALDAPSRGRIAAAVALFVATVLAHKLAAGFALLLSIAPIYVRVRARDSWSRRARSYALLAAAAGVAAMLCAGLLAPERFIGPDDLELLAGLFTRDADFTLAALAVRGGPPLRFGDEVAIAGALALAVVLVAAAARRYPQLAAPVSGPDRALVWGATLIGLFLAVPWLDVGDPQGLGFRLRLFAFVPLALCAAALAGALLGRLTGLVRGALIVGFVVGWVASRPASTREGLVVVEPHMQAAILAMREVVPADHVVICPERHLMFMVTWYTGGYARLRPDEVPAARRWRLLPSALISPPLHAAIDAARQQAVEEVPRPRGLHPRHRNGVVLMPEATWQWILSRLSPAARAPYDEWRTI